jgi:hypothetical protein
MEGNKVYFINPYVVAMLLPLGNPRREYVAPRQGNERMFSWLLSFLLAATFHRLVASLCILLLCILPLFRVFTLLHDNLPNCVNV